MADYLREVADQLDDEPGERDSLAILVREGAGEPNPAYAFLIESTTAHPLTDRQLLDSLKEMLVQDFSMNPPIDPR